eukprot:Rmarinus@m.15360
MYKILFGICIVFAFLYASALAEECAASGFDLDDVTEYESFKLGFLNNDADLDAIREFYGDPSLYGVTDSTDGELREGLLYALGLKYVDGTTTTLSVYDTDSGTEIDADFPHGVAEAMFGSFAIDSAEQVVYGIVLLDECTESCSRVRALCALDAATGSVLYTTPIYHYLHSLEWDPLSRSLFAIAEHYPVEGETSVVEIDVSTGDIVAEISMLNGVTVFPGVSSLDFLRGIYYVFCQSMDDATNAVVSVYTRDNGRNHTSVVSTYISTMDYDADSGLLWVVTAAGAGMRLASLDPVSGNLTLAGALDSDFLPYLYASAYDRVTGTMYSMVENTTMSADGGSGVRLVRIDVSSGEAVEDDATFTAWPLLDMFLADAPFISKAVPYSARVGETQTVTLYGVNFFPVSHLYCNFVGVGETIAVYDASARVYRCDTPAASESMDTRVEVIFSADGETFRHSNLMQFNFYEAIAIDSVTPAYGVYGGDTRVLLDGGPFEKFVVNELHCLFGNIATRAYFVSSGCVVCQTPPLQLVLDSAGSGEEIMEYEHEPLFVRVWEENYEEEYWLEETSSRRLSRRSLLEIPDSRSDDLVVLGTSFVSDLLTSIIASADDVSGGRVDDVNCDVGTGAACVWSQLEDAMLQAGHDGLTASLAGQGEELHYYRYAGFDADNGTLVYFENGTYYLTVEENSLDYVQRVSEGADSSLSVWDLRHLPATEQDALVRATVALHDYLERELDLAGDGIEIAYYELVLASAVSVVTEYGSLYPVNVPHAAFSLPTYTEVLLRFTANRFQIAESELTYTYYEEPHVRSLEPWNGPVGGDTVVTVTGSGFIESPLLSCRFGTLEVPATFLSPTSVECVSPPQTTRFAYLEVSNNGQDYTADYTPYLYYRTPAITSLDPETGPSDGGTIVHVYGTDFISDPSALCSFSFPGGRFETSPATLVSTDEVLCESPTSHFYQGNVTVEVTFNGQQWTDFGRTFTYYDMFWISPPSGTVSGGTVVTVMGHGFYPTPYYRCRFGVFFVDATYVNETSITCQSPSVSGAQEVVFEVTGRTSAEFTVTANITFTYVKLPQVDGVSPSLGVSSGGTLLSVTGSNFVSFAGGQYLRCLFNDVEMPATIAAANELFCESPEWDLQDGDIVEDVILSVTTNAQERAIATTYYKFYADPTIVSLSPNNGPKTEKTSVGVWGEKFSGSNQYCRFGASTTVGTVVNETLIRCDSPLQPAGVKAVQVTRNLVDFSNSVDYTYFNPGWGILRPASGSLSGGTEITIHPTDANIVDGGSTMQCLFVSAVWEGTPGASPDYENDPSVTGFQYRLFVDAYYVDGTIRCTTPSAPETATVAVWATTNGQHWYQPTYGDDTLYYHYTSTSAAHSYHYDLSSELQVDVPVVFFIQAVDAGGQVTTSGGDYFEVVLTRTRDEAGHVLSASASDEFVVMSGLANDVGVVEDLGTGLYQTNFTLTRSGWYVLEVTVAGGSIATTPTNEFRVWSGETDAATCSAYGNGLSEPAEAGVSQQFYIQARDQYGNLLMAGQAHGNEFFIRSRAVSLEDTSVSLAGEQSTSYTTSLGNGTYLASYGPHVYAGTYELSVTLNGVRISGSPFSVSVEATGASASRTVTYGDGLSDAVAGYNATFTILSSDKYGNLRREAGSEYTVSLKQGTLSFVGGTTYVGGGEFEGWYAATLAGEYSLYVKLYDVATDSYVSVTGSPFSGVEVVAADVDPRTCLVDVRSESGTGYGSVYGYDGLTAAAVGHETTLVITSRDRFGNVRVWGAADAFLAVVAEVDSVTQLEIASMNATSVSEGSGLYSLSYTLPVYAKFHLYLYATTSNWPPSIVSFDMFAAESLIRDQSDLYGMPGPLAVTAVTPDAGPIAGGTDVTVSVHPDSVVDFDSYLASLDDGETAFTCAFAYADPTSGEATTTSTSAVYSSVSGVVSVTCTSPPASGLSSGTLSTLSVYAPDQPPSVTHSSSGSDVASFLYYSDAIELQAVSPSLGPVSGNTALSIQVDGGFDWPSATCRFSDADSGAVVNVTSATWAEEWGLGSYVYCPTPPALRDEVHDVVVEYSPNGAQYVASTQTFTYHRVPEIDDLAPSSGPLSGGTTVTLSGLVFMSSPPLGVWCRFTFDDDVSYDVLGSYLDGDSSIQCKTPGVHAADTTVVSVSYNNQDFIDTIDSTLFEFYTAPVLSSLSRDVSPLDSTEGIGVLGSNLVSRGMGNDAACRFVPTATGKAAADVDEDVHCIDPNGNSYACVTSVRFIVGGVSCSMPPVLTGFASFVDVSLNGQQWTRVPGAVFYFTPAVSSVYPQYGPSQGDESVLVVAEGLPLSGSYATSVACRFFDHSETIDLDYRVAAVVLNETHATCLPSSLDLDDTSVAAALSGTTLPVAVELSVDGTAGHFALRSDDDPADSQLYRYYQTPYLTSSFPIKGDRRSLGVLSVKARNLVDTGTAVVRLLLVDVDGEPTGLSADLDCTLASNLASLDCSVPSLGEEWVGSVELRVSLNGYSFTTEDSFGVAYGRAYDPVLLNVYDACEPSVLSYMEPNSGFPGVIDGQIAYLYGENFVDSSSSVTVTVGGLLVDVDFISSYIYEIVLPTFGSYPSSAEVRMDHGLASCTSGDLNSDAIYFRYSDTDPGTTTVENAPSNATAGVRVTFVIQARKSNSEPMEEGGDTFYISLEQLCGDDYTACKTEWGTEVSQTYRFSAIDLDPLIDISAEASQILVDYGISRTASTRGQYFAYFTATVSGDYELHVRTSGVDIADSPASVVVVADEVDVAATTVTASALTLVAGGTLQVSIHPLDQYLNPVTGYPERFMFAYNLTSPATAGVTDEGFEEPVANAEGELLASATLTRSGEYQVTVTADGVLVGGSPFYVVVSAGVVVPAMSYPVRDEAFLEDLLEYIDDGYLGLSEFDAYVMNNAAIGSDIFYADYLLVADQGQFSLRSVDAYGNFVPSGGLAVEASLQLWDSAQSTVLSTLGLDVQDLADGRYWVTFDTTQAGVYDLVLTVDGEQVATSYGGYERVVVFPSATAASKCESTLSHTAVVAGSVVSLGVATFDAYGNQRDVGGDTISVQVAGTAVKTRIVPFSEVLTDGDDGSYHASFNLTTTGKYKMVVLFASTTTLPNMPKYVTVSAAAIDYSACYIRSVEDGIPASLSSTLFLQGVDIFGNKLTYDVDEAEFSVSISLLRDFSAQEAYLYEEQHTPISSFDAIGTVGGVSVTYTVNPMGNYSLSVVAKTTGNNLANSPYFFTRSGAPGPTLTSARFDDSGTRLIVRFDSDTNRAYMNAGTTDCSLIFEDDVVRTFGTTSSIGLSTATCFWSTARTLEVYLGSKATVLTTLSMQELDDAERESLYGDWDLYLSIRNDTLLASRLENSVPASGRAELLTPSNPPAVTATIVAPEVVGTCDSFTLDARSSSGNAGRKMSYTWTALTQASSRLSDAKGAVTMEQYLLELPESTSTVSFSANDTTKIATYMFSVTVSNWLGESDAAVVSVQKSEFLIPAVAITGTKERTVLRKQTIKLQSEANFPECEKDMASSLNFEWTVDEMYDWSNNLLSSDPDVSLDTATVGSATLTVPAYTLQTYRKYRFRVSVWFDDNPLVTNEATVLVSVGEDSLIAAIAGGNRTHGDESDMLILDASASYDPDAVVGDDGTAFLTYLWECYMPKYPSQARKHYNTTGGPCVTYQSDGTALLPLRSDYSADNAQVAFSSGALVSDDDGVDYVFTVYVRKDAVVDGVEWSRNSSSSVCVLVMPGALPLVEIDVVSGTYSPATGAYVIVAGQTLRLNGHIDGDVVSQTWYLTEGPAIDLNDPSILLTEDRYQSNLALASSVLVPGNTYVFRLEVVSSTGAISTVDSSVHVNRPPSMGSLTISPSEGTELDTVFTLEAPNWSDDAADLPLRYEFSVVVDNVETLLTDVQDDTFVSIQLPRGNSPWPPAGCDSENSTTDCSAYWGPENQVTVLVHIIDQLGGRTTVGTNVTVYPNCADAYDVAETTTDTLLTSYFAVGNMDAAAATLIAGAKVLQADGDSRCAGTSDGSGDGSGSGSGDSESRRQAVGARRSAEEQSAVRNSYLSAVDAVASAMYPSSSIISSLLIAVNDVVDAEGLDEEGETLALSLALELLESAASSDAEYDDISLDDIATAAVLQAIGDLSESRFGSASTATRRMARRSGAMFQAYPHAGVVSKESVTASVSGRRLASLAAAEGGSLSQDAARRISLLNLSPFHRPSGLASPVHDNGIRSALVVNDDAPTWVVVGPTGRQLLDDTTGNETCPGDCYGHGECVEGVCVCDAGYDEDADCAYTYEEVDEDATIVDEEARQYAVDLSSAVRRATRGLLKPEVAGETAHFFNTNGLSSRIQRLRSDTLESGPVISPSEVTDTDNMANFRARFPRNAFSRIEALVISMLQQAVHEKSAIDQSAAAAYSRSHSFRRGLASMPQARAFAAEESDRRRIRRAEEDTTAQAVPIRDYSEEGTDTDLLVRSIYRNLVLPAINNLEVEATQWHTDVFSCADRPDSVLSSEFASLNVDMPEAVIARIEQVLGGSADFSVGRAEFGDPIQIKIYATAEAETSYNEEDYVDQIYDLGMGRRDPSLCPNDCHSTAFLTQYGLVETDEPSHGTCVDGECVCNLGYMGFDCSQEVVCRWWDPDTCDWSTEGCWIVESTTEHAVCNCTHLTDFATYFEESQPKLNIVNPFDPNALSSLATDPRNAIALAIVGAVWVAYFLALMYGRRRDRQDKRQKYINQLKRKEKDEFDPLDTIGLDETVHALVVRPVLAPVLPAQHKSVVGPGGLYQGVLSFTGRDEVKAWQSWAKKVHVVTDANLKGLVGDRSLQPTPATSVRGLYPSVVDTHGVPLTPLMEEDEAATPRMPARGVVGSGPLTIGNELVPSPPPGKKAAVKKEAEKAAGGEGEGKGEGAGQGGQRRGLSAEEDAGGGGGDGRPGPRVDDDSSASDLAEGSLFDSEEDYAVPHYTLKEKVRMKVAEKTSSWATSQAAVSRRSKRFLKQAWDDIKADHPWFSCFFVHPNDTYSRTQRFTIILVAILTTLFVDALFWADQSNARQLFVAAVISACVLVPVNMFFKTIFSRITPKAAPGSDPDELAAKLVPFQAFEVGPSKTPDLSMRLSVAPKVEDRVVKVQAAFRGHMQRKKLGSQLMLMDSYRNPIKGEHRSKAVDHMLKNLSRQLSRSPSPVPGYLTDDDAGSTASLGSSCATSMSMSMGSKQGPSPPAQHKGFARRRQYAKTNSRLTRGGPVVGGPESAPLPVGPKPAKNTLGVTPATLASRYRSPPRHRSFPPPADASARVHHLSGPGARMGDAEMETLKSKMAGGHESETGSETESPRVGPRVPSGPKPHVSRARIYSRARNIPSSTPTPPSSKPPSAGAAVPPPPPPEEKPSHTVRRKTFAPTLGSTGTSGLGFRALGAFGGATSTTVNTSGEKNKEDETKAAASAGSYSKGTGYAVDFNSSQIVSTVPPQIQALVVRVQAVWRGHCVRKQLIADRSVKISRLRVGELNQLKLKQMRHERELLVSKLTEVELQGTSAAGIPVTDDLKKTISRQVNSMVQTRRRRCLRYLLRGESKTTINMVQRQMRLQEKKGLPPALRWVAYFLAHMWCVLCSLYIIVVGVKFGETRSLDWLKSTGLSLILQVFLTDSCRVVALDFVERNLLFFSDIYRDLEEEVMNIFTF